MLIPRKLKAGDEVRVIAPSRSLAIIGEDLLERAHRRFADLGLKVTIGEHANERDEFDSSSVQSRLQDLHQAFADPDVRAIITIIGGFNSNQLLKHIDYELIGGNPKILCGFSDITALQNAITAKTDLVTYSGPHFSTFGMKLGFEYTLDHFVKCLFSNSPFEVGVSETWSDDAWFMNQEDREFIKNPGPRIWQEGSAEGRIVGGNLCTLNLLQGTEFMPSLQGALLFLEDDDMVGGLGRAVVDRDLQSLMHLPEFDGVRALVLGRFKRQSEIPDDIAGRILESKRELAGIPAVSGMDFGHSSPLMTFPIGGEAILTADSGKVSLTITRH